MLIDTKIAIKDLKGEAIKNDDGKVFTFGQALANIAIGAEEGGKMKLFLLATKLYQDAKVEVDQSDIDLLKSVCAKNKSYSALISGQCELLLGELKPVEIKKESKK